MGMDKHIKQITNTEVYRKKMLKSQKGFVYITLNLNEL